MGSYRFASLRELLPYGETGTFMSQTRDYPSRLYRWLSPDPLAGCDVVAGNPGIPSFGQWARVCGPGTAELAGKPGNGNAVYRTRNSAGKRLLRELQRETTGRMLKWRDLSIP